MMVRKSTRKVVALVWIIITCVVLSRGERCGAAGTDFGSAKTINKFGYNITDRMDGNGKHRYYKIRLSHTSLLELKVSSGLRENLYVKVHNGYHNELSKGEITRNVHEGKSQNTFTYYLEKGDYFIEFYTIVAGQRGRFSFVPTVSHLVSDDKESNNDISTAQPLSFERRLTGLLTETDRVDIYSVDMKKDGRLAVNISPQIKGEIDVEIMSPEPGYNEKQRISGGTFTYKRDVKKGIYYVKINAQENQNSGKYNLWLTKDNSKDPLKVPLESKTISVGEAFQLQYKKNPKNATEGVTYISSNSKVATVSRSGKVVGKQSGVAKISIGTKRGEITATCKVKVQEVKVDSLVLNQEKATMEVGDTLVLVGTVLPDSATGKKVSWSTNKPEVAMVNKEGKVTAIAQGVCTITGTTEGGEASRKCTITVKERMNEEEKQDEIGAETTEEMKMERACLVKEGEERVMVVKAVADGKEVKEIRWSSSNSKVLKVDKEGKVIGVSQGVAVVVAQVEGRKNNYCTVLVRR